MKSQPKLFASIIASIVLTCGLVGFSVIKATQHDQPRVREENRQYEASKKPASSNNSTKVKSDNRSGQQDTSLVDTEPAKTSASIFFSKSPDSESNPTAVYGVDRMIDSQTTPEQIVSQVIAGPTQDEKDNGFYGGIELAGVSSCQGQDFKLNVTDGTLTLQFCRDHVSGGSAQDTREVKQLTTSLKQLPGISKVVILNQKSVCLFGTSSDNSCGE